MIRMSSFTILSEQLNGGGYALLNGLTGAIDLISNEFGALLLEKKKTQNDKELYFHKNELPNRLIRSFTKRGHILTCSHQEEHKRLDIISDVLQQSHKKAKFLIVPDMDCNYRCTYCYERYIQNHLTDLPKTQMTFDDIDSIFITMAQITSTYVDTDAMSKNMITLYGGEPLNADNYDIVKYIVTKGAQIGYTFSAITNGHDLDHYLSLLGTGKIEQLQVSIDGPKDVHDLRRIATDGTSSFDKIIRNLKLVMEQTDVLLTIRSQIDLSNVTSYIPLLKLFQKEQWLDNPRLIINAALVVEKDQNNTVQYRKKLMKIMSILKPYCDQYKNVFIGCDEMNYELEIYSSLLTDTHLRFRTSHCGATSGMYIFQPDGRINACLETLGLEFGTIGSYSCKERDKPYDLSDNPWFHRVSTAIKACRDCPYCLICAGGCPNLARINHNDISQPYCDGFKEVYPTILARAVERYLNMLNL